jgi:sporulation protein YlmC with PRC-barrel domain
MTSGTNATLYTLGDRGQTVDGSANDVRGREVRDKDGNGIGKVADLIVDDREGKIRFLLVEHGGFLGFAQAKTLIPVDVVTEITEGSVVIDQSRERVAGAPGYTPDLVDDRPYHSDIYGYYGRPPHWGADYLYPMGLWGMYPGSPPSARD